MGFENYLSPKSNFRLSRCKLRTLRQKESKTTFLGMVQFISHFSPNLPTTAAELWGLFFIIAFMQCLLEKQAKRKLQYYSTQPATIEVDGSQRGLGAVLLQANGSVEFVSKLLSETGNCTPISRGIC